jgi:hypothetical protein
VTRALIASTMICLLSYAGVARAVAVYVTAQQGPFDGGGILEIDVVGPAGPTGVSQTGFEPLRIDPTGLRRARFNLWIDTLGFTLVGFRLNLRLGGGARATDWDASDTLGQIFPRDVIAIGGGGTTLAFSDAGPIAAGCKFAPVTGRPGGNCAFDGTGVPPLDNPGVMLLGTIEIDLSNATPGTTLLEVSRSGARSVFSAAESAVELPIPMDLLLTALPGTEQCETELGQCAADLHQVDANLGQCETELERARTDLGGCKTDLEQVRVDFAECRTDLEQAGSDLQEHARRLDGALTDRDDDGVPDRFDACSGTRSREVDASGCSLEQFCNGFDLSTGFGLAACEHADWKNDEPLGSPEDCDATRYTCAPR